MDREPTNHLDDPKTATISWQSAKMMQPAKSLEQVPEKLVSQRNFQSPVEIDSDHSQVDSSHIDYMAYVKRLRKILSWDGSNLRGRPSIAQVEFEKLRLHMFKLICQFGLGSIRSPDVIKNLTTLTFDNSFLSHYAYTEGSRKMGLDDNDSNQFLKSNSENIRILVDNYHAMKRKTTTSNQNRKALNRLKTMNLMKDSENVCKTMMKDADENDEPIIITVDKRLTKKRYSDPDADFGDDIPSAKRHCPTAMNESGSPDYDTDESDVNKRLPDDVIKRLQPRYYLDSSRHVHPLDQIAVAAENALNEVTQISHSKNATSTKTLTGTQTQKFVAGIKASRSMPKTEASKSVSEIQTAKSMPATQVLYLDKQKILTDMNTLVSSIQGQLDTVKSNINLLQMMD